MELSALLSWTKENVLHNILAFHQSFTVQLFELNQSRADHGNERKGWNNGIWTLKYYNSIFLVMIFISECVTSDRVNEAYNLQTLAVILLVTRHWSMFFCCQCMETPILVVNVKLEFSILWQHKSESQTLKVDSKNIWL